MALTEKQRDLGYREIHVDIYQSEQDGKSRLNGRYKSVIVYDPEYEYFPRTLQFAERDPSNRTRTIIVTYERREEWLNKRLYRRYYVRT